LCWVLFGVPFVDGVQGNAALERLRALARGIRKRWLAVASSVMSHALVQASKGLREVERPAAKLGAQADVLSPRRSGTRVAHILSP